MTIIFIKSTDGVVQFIEGQAPHVGSIGIYMARQLVCFKLSFVFYFEQYSVGIEMS